MIGDTMSKLIAFKENENSTLVSRQQTTVTKYTMNLSAIL